jgi:hypothetical protein
VSLSMPLRLSQASRRLLASLAYTALFAVVAGLAYLTFVNLRAPRDYSAAETIDEAHPIELGNFSTRIEKTAKSQRLVVSFKVRVTTPAALDSFVYVAARNDHTTPGVWGVWPRQEPGGAFTQGGHFRSHDPKTGFGVRLVDSWQRVTAPIDQPKGTALFDTVIVYIVATDGEILLARPFAL